MASVFTERVCLLLKGVPSGSVVTYGSLALAAGSSRAARQVVRILHSQSRAKNLPWHRVVAAKGRIAMRDSASADLQRTLLISEGVNMVLNGNVDLDAHLWTFGNGAKD